MVRWKKCGCQTWTRLVVSALADSGFMSVGGERDTAFWDNVALMTDDALHPRVEYTATLSAKGYLKFRQRRPISLK
jgi:hypothetical protein